MSNDQGLSQKAHNDLVLSFLAVRRAIGVLGFFLPLALLAHGLILGQGIPPSISAAYYGPMREVLIGTLCAQAVFLWSYEGFRPNAGEIISDKITARLAAIGALLIAWAPTGPDGAAPAGFVFDPAQDCTLLQCRLGIVASEWIHTAAAALFFLSLAVYCLVLFPRGRVDSAEKRGSNRIYRLCGWLILICLAVIGLLFATGRADDLVGLRPIFWLETIATFAFATSWLVKGDALQPLVRSFVGP